MTRFYLRNALRKAGGLALALGLACASGGLVPPASANSLYRYVDERGVIHYTNVSHDRRYERVRPPGGFEWSAVRTGERRRYDGLIAAAARETGVPAAMVKAVIHAESAFDPRALSRAGAMGLMQLMPGTARMLGVGQPFRAEENVRGGARYLRELHDRYGNWVHTLAAYNAGPTAVDRHQGVPPYAETQQYVKRVLGYYRRYDGDFPR